MPADDPGYSRWSDQLLVEMSGTLGEIRQATREAANDRRELWEKLDLTHDIVKEIEPVVPVIARLNLRVEALERTETGRVKRAGWLLGAAGGLGFGGASIPKLTEWIGTWFGKS